MILERNRIWMERNVKYILGTVAVFLMAFGAAMAQPLFSSTQDPIAGSRVFGTKGCAHCHAVNGVGGQVGPDLGRIQLRRCESSRLRGPI
jgi:cytochrome c2